MSTSWISVPSLWMCLFFPCFQHSFGEMLIFSLKGWGSWDCSALFPSFSLKISFSCENVLTDSLSCALICQVIHAASTTKCLHIRLCRRFWYYLLIHIQLFEKLSMYRHIVVIWPRSNEVVVLSSMQSDGTLPAENLIFRFFIMLLCL